MKKLLLIATITLFGFNALAQDGFRIGLNAGAPVGDNGDFAAFVANIEFEYDHTVSGPISAGVSAGATVYSGKEEFNDFKYLPLLASIDVAILDNLSVGGDVGYGVSLESNIDGALVYRFQLRYNLSEKFDATGRFTSFSGDLGTLSNVSLGFGYRF